MVAAVSILLYELFAAQLSNLFIPDEQTVALASEFLRVRVLATPLMFVSFFTVYLFQAFGKGKIALFLGVTRWLVFNIPMLFVLNGLFGMFGIVWAQVCADCPDRGVFAYCVQKIPACVSKAVASTGEEQSVSLK